MTVPKAGCKGSLARRGITVFMPVFFLAGLFFAVFFLAAPQRVRAETVGIEAKGVSLWAALHNRRNFQLDVRDELNRPVSARLIESQLKAASAAAAAESSYASRLPQARVVVLALEMLAVAKLFISPFSLPLPSRAVWALPVALRSGPKAYFLGILLCSLVFTAGLLSVKSVVSPVTLASCRPLVLRC